MKGMDSGVWKNTVLRFGNPFCTKCNDFMTKSTVFDLFFCGYCLGEVPGEQLFSWRKSDFAVDVIDGPLMYGRIVPCKDLDFMDEDMLVKVGDDLKYFKFKRITA